ncbi:MAG TPA: hypothetical protein VF529_03975 [Solirubrobacteraceae bacterium]
MLLAAPAAAKHNGEPTVDYFVQRDGFSMLMANPGGHAVSWERCGSDGSGCAAHDDGDGDQQILHVRESDPVGSVFKATQDGVTVSTVSWRGRVRSTKAPSVEGEARVGGWVRPVAGEWEGGWGREGDWLQLQACRNADGSDCKVILDDRLFRCRSDGGRLIPARYEGWWLKVADARISEPAAWPAIGYGAPEDIPPDEAAPAVAVVVVGQIAAGPPPAEDCGSGPWSQPSPPSPPPPAPEPPPSQPQPAAVVRDVIARGSDGRLVVARATCPTRCRLRLVLRQGRRHARVRRTLRAGTTSVALPRRAARRLRTGSVSVTVLIGGRRTAARRARIVL